MQDKDKPTTIIIHPTESIERSLPAVAKMALPVAGAATVVWAGRKAAGVAIRALRVWRRMRQKPEAPTQTITLANPQEDSEYTLHAQIHIVVRQRKSDG